MPLSLGNSGQAVPVQYGGKKKGGKKKPKKGY